MMMFLMNMSCINDYIYEKDFKYKVLEFLQNGDI